MAEEFGAIVGLLTFFCVFFWGGGVFGMEEGNVLFNKTQSSHFIYSHTALYIWIGTTQETCGHFMSYSF